MLWWFPVELRFRYKRNHVYLCCRFSDNEELGAFSLDIHHNFDHHTHSTDPLPCELGPIKDPVNPFRLIKEYQIPSGLTSHLAEVEISIPADVDPGDYHLMVRLTDKAGWQTLRGISIKVRQAIR